MTNRLRTLALVACACAGTATSANAQLTSFTITDGTADFTIASGLTGPANGSGGGSASMRTGLGTSPSDHLFQNWFWYRAGSDTRERALSNQVFGTATGNRCRLVYQEPANDGATANALRVELEYTIHDLSNGGEPHAMLVIGFKIQNLTGGSLSTQFFSYNDLDLNGSTTNTAVVRGADNQTQLVFQGNTTAAYSCSATNHTNFQIGAFSGIRALLTDADVDNLNNTGSPFGPNDYTGANQWGVSLATAGGFQDCLVGSVVIDITRDTCPGDTNGDGDVDADDLVNVILSWGACP